MNPNLITVKLNHEDLLKEHPTLKDSHIYNQQSKTISQLIHNLKTLQYNLQSQSMGKGQQAFIKELLGMIQ